MQSKRGRKVRAVQGRARQAKTAWHSRSGQVRLARRTGQSKACKAGVAEQGR